MTPFELQRVISRVLQKVETEVEKTYANVPEILRQKNRGLAVENRRPAKFTLLDTAADLSTKRLQPNQFNSISSV